MFLSFCFQILPARQLRLLNDVLPPEYATTAEMIAKYIYDRTKPEVPEGIKLKVSVSETPNSWVEYEE
jgi:6-pyruvoyltetrahydropterin/6-carboxytetrahydropterin synthase